MKRVLCVWLPNWPLQRLGAEQPELKGRAIALYEPVRGVPRIVACSPRAAVWGIVRGMPAAEAIALAESGVRDQGSGRVHLAGGLARCASGARARARRARPASGPAKCISLHLIPHDPVADRAALEKLAEGCERFSPIVGLEQAERPESLLLDITGCAEVFGGEAALAERVARELDERGFFARVAVAGTVGAAWALARWGSWFRVQGSGRVHLAGGLARRASGARARARCARPASGPAKCSLNPELRTLNPLTVEALRLPDETLSLLRELGIERIGQVEELPREGLSARFGPELLRRLDQAMGRLPEVVVPHRPPPQAEAAWKFEDPTDRREVLEGALERLMVRVLAQLAPRGEGVVELRCELAAEGTGETPVPLAVMEGTGETPVPLKLAIGLVRPSARPGHLMELLRLQLERLELAGPVSAVEVRATATARLQYRQEELFESDEEREGPEQLAALLERLSSRLGRNAVVRPERVPDAQPEWAYRYEPVISARQRRQSPRVATRGLSDGAARPLRLLREPLSIAVVSVVPDGPPISFRLGGCEHRILHLWGPERIETGWWRGGMRGCVDAATRRVLPPPLWGRVGVGGSGVGGALSAGACRRDYYRVETASGQRCWIFRRLDDGGWFLHGWFD